MILKFSRVREEHLEDIRLWRMSEAVTKYMYTDPTITPQEQSMWYKQITEDATRMDWVVEVDDKGIGVVSLYDIDPLHRRCFWGYYLGEQAARGRRLGKAIELNILEYVFQELRLHKLCGEVFEWNELVVSIHGKYGSRVEGVFRDHIWKRGSYHNVVRVGILQREWEQRIKNSFEYSRAMIEEWEDKKHRILASLHD